MYDLSHEQREALCTRCGTSCLFAIDVKDVPVVIEEVRCRFLERDAAGRATCSVYSERFERARWCADLGEALADGLLGRLCPYVAAAGLEDYPGKVRLTKDEREVLLPVIRQRLLTEGAPEGASIEGLRELLEQTGGGSFEFVEDPERSTIWIVSVDAPRQYPGE